MNRTKNVNKFITNDCLGYLQAIFFDMLLRFHQKFLCMALLVSASLIPCLET